MSIPYIEIATVISDTYFKCDKICVSQLHVFLPIINFVLTVIVSFVIELRRAGLVYQV